jgi:hypothetical protein
LSDKTGVANAYPEILSWFADSIRHFLWKDNRKYGLMCQSESLKGGFQLLLLPSYCSYSTGYPGCILENKGKSEIGQKKISLHGIKIRTG